MPSQLLPLKGTELYPAYTNLPNTIELCFGFDVDPEDPIGGVRGCVDKVSVERLDDGLYSIQLHDVTDTGGYGTLPALISDFKPQQENTQKILHVQMSLANWDQAIDDPVLPTYYGVVWFWKPDEFPTEMANVDSSIHQRIVVMIFDRTSNERVNPTGLRVNMLVTLQLTAENARLIPGGFSS